MAILKLRDEGKLSFEDPVSKYVPELANLPYPTSDSQVLNIRHLLTHSEGFPEDNPWGDRQLHQPDKTMREWMRTGIPFSTSPGTAFEYSNYGFAILGQIVAKASGRPYEDYVRDNILRPLGMNASTFEMSAVPQRTYRTRLSTRRQHLETRTDSGPRLLRRDGWALDQRARSRSIRRVSDVGVSAARRTRSWSNQTKQRSRDATALACFRLRQLFVPLSMRHSRSDPAGMVTVSVSRMIAATRMLLVTAADCRVTVR